MPTVQWSIDASGAETGAAQFDRATQRIEASAKTVARGVEATGTALKRIGESVPRLAGLGSQFDQLGARVDKLAKSQREQTREQDKQIRSGLTLLSTLGGADRAFSQHTNALLRAAAATGELVNRQRVLADVQRQVASARAGGRIDQAFSVAAVNARDLRLNIAGLNTSMGELTRIMTAFGGATGSTFANITANAVSAASAVSRLSGGFVTLSAPLLTAVGALTGFGLALRGTATSARELESILDSARTLGTSVETLQRLDFAGTAEGVKNIGGALQIFTQRLGDAAGGTGQAIPALEKLGLTLRDLRGRDLEAQMIKLADGFAKITDPAERASIAVELFGRSGASMVNLLGGGAAAMQEITSQADRMGIVFSTKTARAADELSDTIETGTRVLAAMKDRAFLALLPVAQALAERFRDLAISAAEFFGAIERQRGASGSWAADLVLDAKAFEDLRRKLDPARAAAAEFAATQEQISVALQLGKITQAEYNQILGQAAEAYKKATTESDKFSESLKKQVEALVQRNEAEFEARRAGPTETPELDRIVDILRKKQDLEAQAAQKAQAKATADAERAARAAQEPYLNAAQAIQSEISGALASAFRGGITDAEDFADAILDIVARMAAEIATTKIFGGILEQVGQGGTGFGGISGIFGGGTAAPEIPADASREEIITILEENRDAVLQTADNTGGMLGLVKSAAAGAAGIGFGFGAAGLLGLPTGIGSAAGGGLGALFGGAFGGPGGAAAGGALGGFIGGPIEDFFKKLLEGKNPFGSQSRLAGAAQGAALGSVFPGFGTAVGAIIGSLLGGEGQKAQVQLRTSLGQTGFRAGISERGPFGFVGIDAARSQGIEQSATRRFAEAVKAFDTALAAAVDPGLIDEVTTALVNTRALRESAQSFDREFNSLLVDRAATVLRASLAGQGVGANVIDEIIKDTLSKSGSAGRQPSEIIDTVTALIQGFADLSQGRTELRGEDVAEGTTALQRLRDAFQELVPAALRFGISLEELQEDLAAGEEALRRTFREDLASRTLALVDPFAAAIDAIAQEEQRLARETAALGTGMAEAAAFIAASREDLAKRATAPTTALLEELALDRLGPAAARDVLGQRFTAALGGTDAGAVAETARALIEANERFFGRTSLFFESQSFIQRSLETFNERIREQALSDVDAINAQTDTLSANQEEQTQILFGLLAETKSQRAEIERLRADLSLVLSRLAKTG